MASAVAFSPPYTDSDGPEESMYNDFYRHTDDVCYPYMSSSQQVATAVHRRRQDEQLQYMSVPVRGTEVIGKYYFSNISGG